MSEMQEAWSAAARTAALAARRRNKVMHGGGDASHEIVQSLSGLRGDDAADHLNRSHGIDSLKAHTIPGIESLSTGGGRSNSGPMFTPERAALHQRIIEAFLGDHAKQADPQALFTAGGPAAGKSSLLTKLPIPKDAVDVNPDLVKEYLPEYQALKNAGRTDVAGAAVHEESSHVAAMITQAAMAGKRNLIIDGVGNSGSAKFAGKITTARDSGYNTTVRYAHIPVEEALAREQARAARTGRHVAPEHLIGAHRSVSARYSDEVRHIPGVNVDVFNTGVARGSTPSLISHTRDDQTTVMDNPKQQEFEAKRLAGLQEAKAQRRHGHHRPMSEKRIPPDSATYLEKKKIRYPKGHNTVKIDGKHVDLNDRSPFGNRD